MRLLAATEPGSPGVPNEDFFAMACPAGREGGALVVLDGVTGDAAAGDGCRHGVAWFVARLGGALLERALARRAAPLADCLATAIERTAAAHRATCDLSHPRTPQATVVCARWGEAAVEYLVLCDAVLLLQAPGGSVRQVTDARLDELRPAARRLPAAAARAAFLEGMRNAEGGFFTAAADPAVAGRAVAGSTERERVRALAAVTDGAGRWVDVFRLGGWDELFAALAGAGPGAVIGQVRAAERADPAGRAFPRGKAHDDATAVLAEL